jgi:hypothetical protein
MLFFFVPHILDSCRWVDQFLQGQLSGNWLLSIFFVVMYFGIALQDDAIALLRLEGPKSLLYSMRQSRHSRDDLNTILRDDAPQSPRNTRLNSGELSTAQKMQSARFLVLRRIVSFIIPIVVLCLRWRGKLDETISAMDMALLGPRSSAVSHYGLTRGTVCSMVVFCGNPSRVSSRPKIDGKCVPMFALYRPDNVLALYTFKENIDSSPSHQLQRQKSISNAVLEKCETFRTQPDHKVAKGIQTVPGVGKLIWADDSDRSTRAFFHIRRFWRWSSSEPSPSAERKMKQIHIDFRSGSLRMRLFTGDLFDDDGSSWPAKLKEIAEQMDGTALDFWAKSISPPQSSDIDSYVPWTSFYATRLW